MRPLKPIFRLASRGERTRRTYLQTPIRQHHQTTCSASLHHPFCQAGRPRTNPLPIPSLPVRRHESNTSVSSSSQSLRNAEGNRDQPSYEMTFTCKRCSTRSTHRVTKQGYFHGTVLIACPGCKNRHLISDHLGVCTPCRRLNPSLDRAVAANGIADTSQIFSDQAVTLEDLMREKGHMIKKGTLSEEGDVEFWDDGTTRRRLELGVEKVVEEEVKARAEAAAAAAARRAEDQRVPGESFKGGTE